MKKPFLLLLSTGAVLLGLAACSGTTLVQKVENESQYWQRADVSEAAYMEGPKSQQMLNRDISRCVVEIRELERLGAIRTATPADTQNYGVPPNPHTPEGQLADWDTPERDGYLRAEHLDYHDFETCMIYKGWERVEYLPYDLAEKSREEYITNITGEKYRSKVRERQEPIRTPDETNWEGLNE
jgi:hypothetical protein